MGERKMKVYKRLIGCIAASVLLSGCFPLLPHPRVHPVTPRSMPVVVYPYPRAVIVVPYRPVLYPVPVPRRYR